MAAPVWMAVPPEIHSTLLSSGAGPGPLLAAGEAWNSLSIEYAAVADELNQLTGAVQAGTWDGSAAEAYVAANVPYVAWLLQASADSAVMAAQQQTVAAAYSTALATMPTLAELATNHMIHGVLVATNFFGINTIPIALNEADYVRMWIQAATTMSVYQAVSTAAVAAAPQTVPAPRIVRSVAAPNPAAGSDNPLIQELSQLINQWTTTPNQFGLDQLMSQLGLGQLFSQVENFEGANNFFNLILPGNPFTPYPPGTTFQEALSNIWISFTQGTFVYDPQVLHFAAGNPTHLLAELMLFATQLVTHRITDFIQLTFNFPQLLGAVVPGLTAPVGGLAGVSGLAGLADLAQPLPEPAPALIPAPAPDLQPAAVIAPVAAPAAAPALGGPPVAAPPAAAPPPPPPAAPPAPVAAAAPPAFPYLVGGPSIGSGTAMSTAAGAGAKKKASKPASSAAAAGTAATEQQLRARRRRRRMRGYGDEYMELNIEVEPDWDAGPDPAAVASERGAGALGFAGTGVQPRTAAGLATLPGDAFGDGPTMPMMPGGWGADRDDG